MIVTEYSILVTVRSLPLERVVLLSVSEEDEVPYSTV